MFEVLRRHQMKLNLTKCAFGVAFEKFLGYMVNQSGIEANPEKIQALLDMKLPSTVKEVQKLTGRIDALNHFVSKAIDRCLPFFRALTGNKQFEQTLECEQAFQDLKVYLGSPPLLSKPVAGEVLYLYLAVSPSVVSTVLLHVEDRTQHPVYYVNHSKAPAETRYPEMEQLALALLVATQKLKLYFQAHPIVVFINYSLKQIFQKPEASGCIIRWTLELSQFDIQYKPRTAIKGQFVANFIAEFMLSVVVPTNETSISPSNILTWTLFVDGSSSHAISGAGLLLISSAFEKLQLEYVLRLNFKASNNEAEYEALIAGLKLARVIGVQYLTVFSDSQLVVN